MPYFIATSNGEDWSKIIYNDLTPIFPITVKAGSLAQACDIFRYYMKIIMSDIDTGTLKVAELKEMGHFNFDNKQSSGTDRNVFQYNEDTQPSHGGSFVVTLRTTEEIDAWEKQKYCWVDPDLNKSAQIKCNKYMAVRREAAHKSIPLMKPYHSEGLEHIDGDDWELFRASFTMERDGITFYYGSFVEGLGAFNVMVAQENIRDLTDAEKQTFSGKQYGMYGSHTGNLSYVTTLPEIK